MPIRSNIDYTQPYLAFFRLVVQLVVAGFVALNCVVELAVSADVTSGLVGHWTFDDGTGKDVSGHASNANVDGSQIYRLENGQNCLRFLPGGKAATIAVSPDSPLAIAHGTIAFWLNVAWTDTVNVLNFDNDAVQLNIYRGHFQPRFRGESKFKYSSGVIDLEWPKYDLREWAFYPHERAVVGDSVWHHFAVAYDDQAKRIIGWRDGEQIATIDLSNTPMEPLRRRGLKQIVIGDQFVGFLDDLRVYDRALTDQESRSLFEASRAVYANRSDTIASNRKMTVYQYQDVDRSLYRAWLQYYSPAGARRDAFPKSIVAESKNSTVQTAALELAQAIEDMFHFKPTIGASATRPGFILGTPDTSAWIREHKAVLGLERVKNDGFVIRAVNDGQGKQVVVAANIPAGVVFGAFDLIRRLQLGSDPLRIDTLENPKIPIRMVDHWSNFRGFPHDDWRGSKPGSKKSGNRDAAIFSWEDLRTGDSKLIRDWVRMLSSCGWNALCPSEVNWNDHNNYLEHLDEVEKLAEICRDYGIKLYWSPNYLSALQKEAADKLYARVPDFGGYVLKLGSEKQNGDPRPQMVNRIADTLRPHGGYAVVRGFVYGNGRYDSEPYRNLIPYDIFAQEDGNYRDNVVIVPKGSPLDWDFSAPLPALDGAIQKNLSGSELVIDKNWPVSWVEKWKWWLEQDNFRRGPGSLNKFDVDCIMGVSMISPAPAWSESPLNMVNYYGLGRLAWNPDLSIDEIYSEWIRQTFGDDPDVTDTVKTILLLSDDVARKLCLYRGYRGVWIDASDPTSLVKAKSTHTANHDGIGTKNAQLQERTLAQYAPGLQAVYRDPILGEEFLPSFHFAGYDECLSSGRTVAQDFCANLNEAVPLAEQMAELWNRLEGKVDKHRFDFTAAALRKFVDTVKEYRQKTSVAFERSSGRNADEVVAELTQEKQAAKHVYNVRDYGAKLNAAKNNAPAINAAIDACTAAGGGTVFVPSGIYGCGTIHLKSNVTLALDAGAVLKALPDAMDPWEPNPFDAGLMDPAYYHWRASLVCGENLEHVKLLGPGTLDGTALTRSSKVRQGVGDKGIALKRCRDIEILNLKIQEGGHYAILATGCEDLRIDNVSINTSRDGLNLAQCRKVLVANSHINSVRYADGKPAGGDDAIKLGSDLSLGTAAPSEQITVRNCYLASGCNALQFGTETAGSFRNIRFENIRIGMAGKAGIGITSCDGSVIDDVNYKDVSMENTLVPFFIKVSDVARVPSGTYKQGGIRNVKFENITCKNGGFAQRDVDMPSVIWGKRESAIENLDFVNVRIVAKGGHSSSDASLEPAENDERFPQNVGKLPAYAWYIRNAKNIQFLNCDFGAEKNDGRPAMVIDNSANIELNGSKLAANSSGKLPIVTRNGATFTVHERDAGGPHSTETSGDHQDSRSDAHPPQDSVKSAKKDAAINPPLALQEPGKTSKGAGMIFEAELAKLKGVERNAKRKGFTGDGYVDFRHAAGDCIEWNIPVKASGDYRLAFRYSLKKEARSLELRVNGKVVESAFLFPSTQAWDTWETAQTVAALKKGANTVRLTTTGANGGNLDYLEVEPATH